MVWLALCSRRLLLLLRVVCVTPAEAKCELGRVRGSIRQLGTPCLARHSQGVTGALLAGSRFFASTRGAKPFFLAFCHQTRQPAPREGRRISQRPWWRVGRSLEPIQLLANCEAGVHAARPAHSLLFVVSHAS